MSCGLPLCKLQVRGIVNDHGAFSIHYFPLQAETERNKVKRRFKENGLITQAPELPAVSWEHFATDLTLPLTPPAKGKEQA